jgi:hypothetical protein
MARIDTARLVRNATDLSLRAIHVQQDPAVRKAWREVAGDTATAAKSAAKAVDETGAAWRRNA